MGYGDPVWFKLIGDGLTTVQLPVQEMRWYATSLLLMRFEGSSTVAAGSAGEASRFAPALVVRGSTAPSRIPRSNIRTGLSANQPPLPAGPDSRVCTNVQKTCTPVQSIHA